MISDVQHLCSVTKVEAVRCRGSSAGQALAVPSATVAARAEQLASRVDARSAGKECAQVSRPSAAARRRSSCVRCASSSQLKCIGWRV